MEEKYEYVNAMISCGRLYWDYKIEGNSLEGTLVHDEDAFGWSDDHIIDVTMEVLGIEEDDRDIITVYWD